MYEVKVYDKDDIVITAEVFNTLEEAFKFFDIYALDYYTEVNRLEDDSEDDLSDLSEYNDLILAITDDATFSDI
jgi:hypothetical protein